MNIELWRKHQTTPLALAKTQLRTSHLAVLRLIETYTEDELFTLGALPWTEGSTLGEYCHASTSSHYKWAIRKLGLYRKLAQTQPSQ